VALPQPDVHKKYFKAINFYSRYKDKTIFSGKRLSLQKKVCLFRDIFVNLPRNQPMLQIVYIIKKRLFALCS